MMIPSDMECGDLAPLSENQSRPSAPSRENEPASVPGQSGAEAPHFKEATDSRCAKPWHHSPVHWLTEKGVYMVTAGAYRKVQIFQSPERRQFLHDRLHACTQEFGWKLHAWAILGNHYHFIAESPDDAQTLRRLLNKLHMTTAKEVNRLDHTPGRKVWFEYWDTRLTHQRSYLARMRYVNHNPVHHRLVTHAVEYPWCSAAHFAKQAEISLQRTVASMPIDQLNVPDDF